MATKTLRANSNNDLYLADGRNLSFLEDAEACAQDIRSNALVRTGEDIYNVNFGVGYFEYIFTPQQSYDDARRSLIEAMLSSPDVISVESLTMTVTGDIFEFEAVVNTLHGPIRVTTP